MFVPALGKEEVEPHKSRKVEAPKKPRSCSVTLPMGKSLSFDEIHYGLLGVLQYKLVFGFNSGRIWPFIWRQIHIVSMVQLKEFYRNIPLGCDGFKLHCIKNSGSHILVLRRLARLSFPLSKVNGRGQLRNAVQWRRWRAWCCAGVVKLFFPPFQVRL